MKVESFKIENWEELQTGLILAENDEWILVKHIPVDFVIDGYRLHKKQFINERINGSNEQLIEKVFRLRNIDTEIPVNFEFTDTYGFLKSIQEKCGIFEFQDDDETELFYGRINKVINKSLTIDFILANGQVEEEYEFKFDLNKIRVITFESDYFDAIRLLWMDANN